MVSFEYFGLKDCALRSLDFYGQHPIPHSSWMLEVLLKVVVARPKC